MKSCILTVVENSKKMGKFHSNDGVSTTCYSNGVIVKSVVVLIPATNDG